MATPTSLPASFVAGDVLLASQLNNLRGAFRVLQVQQSVVTTTFSTTSTSYVDVTGMSVTITPSSTSSKILVIAHVSFDQTGALHVFQFVRGSTAIYIGDAAGSRRRATGGSNGGSTSEVLSRTPIYLDSPNTTSATTYKIQAAVSAASFNLNSSALGTDSTDYYRTASSITVMEISA